jgi:hypothetical protein
MRADEGSEIRYEDSVEDHERRIMGFVRLLEQGSALDPLVIGADGSLWDGMHRLAALYACHIEEVEVLDFSAGGSKLLQLPVSLNGVLAPQFRSSAGIRVLHEQFSKAEPYRHLFVPNVFDPEFADAMLREMEGLPWTLSTTEFYEQYEVSLLDTEHSFSDTAFDHLRELALSAAFRKLISAITGKGSLKVADVACHRSTTDQQIGIHNDFYPGGETCRFTIHLNPGWKLEEGGLFVTLASGNSKAMTSAYPPTMNSALVFEISTKSYHAVTPVTSTRPRYSIVISFLQDDPRGPESSEATRLARLRQNKLPLLRPDVVDVETLGNLRTRRCAPLSCGGACCREGAGLIPEEIPLLNQIAIAYGEELSDLGVKQPATSTSGLSARTSLVSGPDGLTRCSWLANDGRCSLQVLGENHAQEPWFYKPLACMLMPLRVRSTLGARVLMADHRASVSTAEIDPCLRYDETAPELGSVAEEMEFIARVWDIDVRALLDLANSVSSPQSHHPSKTIGIVTATETHWLTAERTGDGEYIEVVKRPLPGFESGSPCQDQPTLGNLSERWFPKISETGSEDRATRMSFVAGHVPLNVWLSSRPTMDQVAEVARDMLRALVELEDAEIFHLDLAPRNVLVQPTAGTVVIVDFEDMIDNSRQVECAGGSFGFAAPEQYLNYLGPHTRVTESFFVGAFLFQAFNHPGSRKKRAFPFADFELVPESIRGAMLALIGDPLRFYDPQTRMSARDVLSKFEVKRTAKRQCGESMRICASDQTQRILTGQGGSTLVIDRRGLTLSVGENIIARWKALIDVANAPARWVEPLRIGPLLITVDGISRFDSLEPDNA